MNFKKWILATVLAALLGAAPVVLADQSELKSAFKDMKSSCQDDINKYCNNIKPGKGQLSSCLNSNSAALSSSCNDARQKVSTLISQAHMNFEKQCGSDVQKFCSSESGRKAVHDCLNQHLDSLSSSCKSLQAKIDQRIDKGLG